MLPPVLPTEDTAPNLPPIVANLLFTLDQPVIVIGEKVLLTIQVQGKFEAPIKELWLTLVLPEGVTAEGTKAELRWLLPAQLADAPFVQQVTLQVDPARLGAESAVQHLVATLSAPGYEPSQWVTTIGVARDKGSSAAIIETRQSAAGTVLQEESGFLSLLVQPAAAKAETRLVYTELYRWDKAVGQSDIGPKEVVTATTLLSSTSVVSQTAKPAQQLFLPMVAGGDGVAAAVTVGAAPAELPPAQEAGGVQFYYHWAFTAEQDGAKVTHFDEALQLSLSLAKLVAAGVDPARVELWTREDAKGGWQIVRSDYDPKTQRLTAFLPHFTEFGLGTGLSQQGEILPSIVGFMVDRLTGNASAQHAIETPAGAGGLNPNLRFGYSSMAVDDLFLDSGFEYLAQTSGVGMGWGVSGSNNFVVRTEVGYSVMLNGMRLNLRYEENAWRTDPESFFKVQWAPITQGGANPIADWGTWTFTAPDGTKYEFGDGGTFAGFSDTSATAVIMATNSAGNTAHSARQWYLRQVTDTLGNYISYSYHAEQGFENGCVYSNWPLSARWYTRAVYPTEIRWGGNLSTGLTPKLKVLFTYDSQADREDYEIDGWGSNDCKQVKFATRDRLLAVTVQVDSSGWQTLRSYLLNQSYYLDPGTAKKRLLLNTIETHGKNGGLLQTYTFTYKYGDGIAAGPNRIWLRSTDNGWGGTITYGYTSQRPACLPEICGQNTIRTWRNPATQIAFDDGLNHISTIKYYYGPVNFPGNEWGRIGVEDGSALFFGFKQSEATYYKLNSTFTVQKWDKQESWPGSDVNPDPRAGKPKRLEVRTAKNGTVVAVTNYQWEAYRRVNGAWTPTAENQEMNSSGVTYPIIWVRQASVDNWTAGGAWAGANYINGSGSGTQTKTFYDGTTVDYSGVARGVGNVVQVEEYSHTDIAYLDLATWEARLLTNPPLTEVRKTLTDYFPGLAVINAPARVRVYAGTTCKSEQRYIYDNVNNNYNTAPTAGILKKTEQTLAACSNTSTIAPYDGNWLITRLDHDAYGNLTMQNRVGDASDGSQNQVLLTTFDSIYHRFPVQQSYQNNPAYVENATYYGVNGLALSDSKAFWGAMQEHCGVNDLCTRQSYDEFGRPIRTWEQVVAGTGWGTDASAQRLRAYYMVGYSGLDRNVLMEWRAPRCYGNFTRKVYNGLGQLVQEQRPQQGWKTVSDDCNGGTSNAAEVDTNYAYDALGNLAQVSVPIATTASWINRNLIWNQGDTETLYDQAGRVARIYAPNEERQDYAYAGRFTGVYGIGRNGDLDKKVGWQEVDELGNLHGTRTWDWNGTAWVVQGAVTMNHDVLGNLESVTHPGGIGTTTMTYDLAGRKTSMVDPDLGTWQYSYNRQSQLVRQTDARQKTICLYYDGLARLLGKYFRDDVGVTPLPACPNNTTYHVTYTYDQYHGTDPEGDGGTDRSRGQLTSVSTGSYNKAFYYNDLGLLRRETLAIAGASSYTTGYAYDSYRRPSVTQYPDGETTTVQYNSMGLPAKLTSSTLGDLIDGSTNVGAVTNAVNYDIAGRLTALHTTGNNRYVTYSYLPWTGTTNNANGRLGSIKVGRTSGAADLLSLGYSYDSFGNISSLTEQYNAGTSATNSFGYDQQNRLTEAYNPLVTGPDYSYDSAGRLTGYEGLGYTYDSTHMHAVDQVNGIDRYDYDANGNMLIRNKGLSSQQSLTWNHENQLAMISGGGLPTESYLYDADGSRIIKTSNGVSTYYISPLFEVTGSDVTRYYYFNGQRVAMHKSGTLTYLHSDHLGSTVLTTDISLNPTGDQRYFAYGKQRDTGPVATDHQFTGQKLDGTGLQYYNARYYDPTLGTFISPDTIVPDPGTLIDYNRYAYSRANPLKYNDPSGHEAFDASNYPCSYTGCILDKMTGQMITVPAAYWSQPAPLRPDGISIFFPFSAVNTTGESLAGGIEILQNHHTGDVTAFLVVGASGAGIGAQKLNLTTPALIKPFLINDVFQIGDNNLNYSGTFVAIEGTGTYVVGATAAYAYTPQKKGTFTYWLQNNEASYSSGLGPAGGMGGGASLSIVEYIPLLTYREGRVVLEAGSYLFDANQQAVISQMVSLGVDTINYYLNADSSNSK